MSRPVDASRVISLADWASLESFCRPVPGDFTATGADDDAGVVDKRADPMRPSAGVPPSEGDWGCDRRSNSASPLTFMPDCASSAMREPSMEPDALRADRATEGVCMTLARYRFTGEDGESSSGGGGGRPSTPCPSSSTRRPAFIEDPTRAAGMAM